LMLPPLDAGNVARQNALTADIRAAGMLPQLEVAARLGVVPAPRLRTPPYPDTSSPASRACRVSVSICRRR
jgi:hypothetical protein